MDVPNKLIVRNTVLNLVGLVVPLAVGFVTIPMVVRALGNERFGILALVWVVFGYFGLFDLGLGRTTTRYVADCLGRNEPRQAARLSLDDRRAADGDRDRRRLSFASGRAAHRPARPQHPGRLRGRDHPDPPPRRLVAAGHVRRSSFRGVLEAAQRFDLVNAVKVPVNILFYVLPLVGVAMGFALPGIVVLLVLSRAAALVVWGGLALRVLPALRTKPVLRRELVRPLFSFSGWLGLSGILYAVTTSLDRLIIGSLITVEAVTFYSAPYEAINRLGVVPGSLSMVLFPAFSLLDAGGREDTVGDALRPVVEVPSPLDRARLHPAHVLRRRFPPALARAGFRRPEHVRRPGPGGRRSSSTPSSPCPTTTSSASDGSIVAPKYQAFELVAFAGHDLGRGEALGHQGRRRWPRPCGSSPSPSSSWSSLRSRPAGSAPGFVWKNGLAGVARRPGAFRRGPGGQRRPRLRPVGRRGLRSSPSPRRPTSGFSTAKSGPSSPGSLRLRRAAAPAEAAGTEGGR